MKIFMATMGLGIGGAETHIVELAKELKRQGHDVAVASNGGVYVAEIETEGIRHYEAPMHRRSIPLMVKSLFILRKVIKKERPDVVHAHARIPAFLCGILKKRYKFPFVTTAHWVFKTGGGLKFLTDWGEKTVAVSEDIKEYLKVNYGVKDENIFVTINGIDEKKFSPEISGENIRREFDIPENVPVVAHVSRLDESRALAARKLIEGAEQIASAVKDVVILIAGGGDVFDELYAKAEETNRKLGYRCIIMTGGRTDINEITAVGDIFVGVSRAALEAMSGAKPAVVAGNEGYLGLFAEDKLALSLEGNFCCRGCPMVETDTLAKDVIAALKMTDEEKSASGNYGREVTQKYYSVGKMAQDTLTAYNAAIPPKKILMSGYYGFSNAGDEAILSSVYASVRNSAPNAEVTVLSNNPAATAKTCCCRAVERFAPVKLFREIKNCDLLVSGGGSLLQDRTSTRSLLYYLFIIRLAELMGKKVILYANGIGPVEKKGNRRLVGKACNAADVITLRDADSLRELKDMNVTKPRMAITADPVYLLNPAEDEVVNGILSETGVPEGGFIAVSVRKWDGMKKFAVEMAKLCDGLYEKLGKNIVFVSMQTAEDSAAAAEIRAQMKSPAYEIDGKEPLELMGVIGKADMILSMRLHSVIFAARMKTPVAGVSYDPKVASSLEMLEMPSMGSVEQFNAADALETAVALYENRDAARQSLSEKMAELASRAAANEQYLKELL